MKERLNITVNNSNIIQDQGELSTNVVLSQVVAGAPDEDDNHFQTISTFALHIQAAVRELIISPLDGSPIEVLAQFLP